jgi:DNA polymerase III gamma/tau subunit
MDPNDELEAELDLEDNPPDDPAGEPDPDGGQDAGGADEIEAQPGDDQQVLQPSRRDGRIQRLIEEKRRSDADAAALRQRLDELTRQPVSAPSQQHQETDAERAARYDGMSQGDAIAQALRESEQRFAARMNQSAFQTADISDKTAFETKAATSRLRAHWKDKVEEKLVEMRRQGINTTREILYKFMVGEQAVERYENGGGRRQATEAGRRVQQRQARVGDSGSDISPPREPRRGSGGGNDAAARERRLANVIL